MKRWKTIGIAVMTALILAAILLAAIPLISAANAPEATSMGEISLHRASTPEEEGYSVDNRVCAVDFVSDDGYVMTLHCSYEDWLALPETAEMTGTLYLAQDGAYAVLQYASEEEAKSAVFASRIANSREIFNSAMAVFLAAAAVGIVTFTGKFFSKYEKIWFLSVLILAAVFAILFPEEDCNGVNGLLIMALYLADTLLNILCELMISKQSKWNFIVSIFVEITEILICVVLAYRFATMVTTLFFWLPIDIVSFINWHRHPDKKEEELTEVRRLRGWQEVLLLVGIAVWTFGIGTLLTTIDLGTDLFGGNEVLAVVVCYLDACASAVGIANGLFIFFRYEEQWFAWMLEALLEGVINVLSGQFVLLVLKAGYLTNSTYGYVRWSRYIKNHPEAAEKKSIF